MVASATSTKIGSILANLMQEVILEYFLVVPSIDNTNNATPEATDADDASITSPTSLIRRAGAKTSPERSFSF